MVTMAIMSGPVDCFGECFLISDCCRFNLTRTVLHYRKEFHIYSYLMVFIFLVAYNTGQQQFHSKTLLAMAATSSYLWVIYRLLVRYKAAPRLRVLLAHFRCGS